MSLLSLPMSRAVSAMYYVAGGKLPHEWRQDPINAEHNPFGHHNAILLQQPVHCIHQGRPLPYEPLAHAMECLDILQIRRS